MELSVFAAYLELFSKGKNQFSAILKRPEKLMTRKFCDVPSKRYMNSTDIHTNNTRKSR